MKKIMIIALMAGIFWSCNNTKQEETGFNIEGTISGYQDTIIHLKKRANGEWVTVDSSTVTEGKFHLKGKVDQPEVIYLYNEKMRFTVPVFVENANITITGSMDDLGNIKIEGSNAQKALDAYNMEVKTHDDKMNDLYKQWAAANKEGNKELMGEIEDTYSSIEDEKLNFAKNYIGSNNKSIAVPYILLRQLSYSLDLNELDSLFQLIDPSLAESPYYKDIDKRIKTLQSVAVGKEAPDFTLNDTTGNPVSLSQFRGKYVLIDFWAAWCRPCRAENPNNVKLYADYKDKGFEILGVSFDNTRDAWVKAIKKDGLTWTQVSDLKGWKSAAGKLYGVNSIPHTVLLDKNGVIIAKNLRGKELREKVAELLD